VGSDVNIVNFWSTLDEVTGVVWDAYKLGAGAPLCINLNIRWHYAPKKSGWGTLAQLPSYMDKLLTRSHNMAEITLRVGILVVSIRLVTAKLIVYAHEVNPGLTTN
jgi:hypothetical protein